MTLFRSPSPRGTAEIGSLVPRASSTLESGLQTGSRQGVRRGPDRKSTRLNSSHTEIYTLSLHDALPISLPPGDGRDRVACSEGLVYPRIWAPNGVQAGGAAWTRSEEHTSELQSHRDLHSFPT